MTSIKVISPVTPKVRVNGSVQVSERTFKKLQKSNVALSLIECFKRS